MSSPESLATLSTGVEICFQTFGSPDGDPLLLVMGLGGPMIWWDEEFCQQLADHGFFVIRYDNRDTGRSTKIKARATRTRLVRAFAGRGAPPPYTLTDMSDDAFALLDHLDIDAAHIVGVSMGGMIVQTMALAHPERVLSMTSIMSTTGRRTVGWQHPKLLPMLIAPRGPGKAAYAETSARMWRMIGSPGYPKPVEESRALAEATFDRGFSASGVMRQMLAILDQPDRSRALRELRVPSLVIHGLSDRMVHVSGGRATAAAIPGAELILVPGMGHDMPPALFGDFAEAIRRTADRAETHA
ncbi:MAG: alpha/beta fold hydrolase [Nocardioides sp.]|jgi:pimeloyl-ACP methyl ester carboxylesterase